MGLGLLAVLALAGPAGAATVDRVAGVVNDDVITLSEVYELGADFIEEGATQGPEHRRAAELEVLDSLIERRLIGQEIQRLEIDVTDQDLDRAIDDVARRNALDRDQLREAVEGQGMSWTQYRDELRESLRQQQFTAYVMQTRISVDEEELKDAYRRRIANDPPAVTMELGAFMLSVPAGADEAAVQAVVARAEAARARVLAGEAFTDVAVQVDEGNFKDTGGRMGSVKQGQLRPELETPALAAAVGSPTPPIVTQGGVLVLYVFERASEAPPPFEEMRPELEQELYQARVEDEIDQWMQQARRQAAVQILLEPAQ